MSQGIITKENQVGMGDKRFNTNCSKKSIRGMHPDIIITDWTGLYANEFGFIYFNKNVKSKIVEDRFLGFTINLN